MSEFLRKGLRSAAGYVPGEQWTKPCIKLNTNECPYPPSPEVGKAIDGMLRYLARYPRPMADAARTAMADLERLPVESVLVGNGSDDILSLAFRAWLEPGDGVVFPKPTYSLYDNLASFSGARVLEAPRRDDFSVDVDAVLKVGAKLIVIASPNSPTGTVTPVEDIARLAKKCPDSIVLVDEAYADFAGVSAASLVSSKKNVVVVRTLSKSYALAGLRVGFALAPKPLIEDLFLLKDSYNVGSLPAVGAAAALRDQRYAKFIQSRVNAAKRRLVSGLETLGWRVFPSGANFVFAEPPARDGGKVYEFLRERNILVRWFGNDPRTAGGVRITVGMDEEIDHLLEALSGYGR